MSADCCFRNLSLLGKGRWRLLDTLGDPEGQKIWHVSRCDPSSLVSHMACRGNGGKNGGATTGRKAHGVWGDPFFFDKEDNPRPLRQAMHTAIHGGRSLLFSGWLYCIEHSYDGFSNAERTFIIFCYGCTEWTSLPPELQNRLNCRILEPWQFRLLWILESSYLT